MHLVEQHIINHNHSLYNECDRLCFVSKNIYNETLYLIRKEYEESKTYNVLNDPYKYLKNEDCFKVLPQKVSQATLKSLRENVKSFFSLLKSQNVDNKNVEFPHYLHKTKGRYVTTYNYQAISKKVFKASHKIKLSQCNVEFYTRVDDFKSIDCVRIIPQLDRFTIEVVYTVNDVTPKESTNRCASIDLGVSNLATITYNNGNQPVIVNGKPLKSMNHYYNKKLAFYKSKIERVNKRKSSHRVNKLHNKRNNKVNNYLHKASKFVVNNLINNDITTLVVGQNKEWKQKCNIGKRNNQNFIQIPHSRFIQMLIYKCEKVGIKIKIQEESYTSKCSFLDNEEIKKHDTYMGQRVKRGLFKSSSGKLINADVNGSFNILRKAIPNAFSHGIQGLVVNPIVIKL